MRFETVLFLRRLLVSIALLSPSHVFAQEGSVASESAGEDAVPGALPAVDAELESVEPAPVEESLAVEQAMAMERDRRERRHLLHPSREGPVGGVRVVDAGSGAVGAYRVLFGAELFIVDEWLVPEGRHSHLGGTLAVNHTPREFLELYATASVWRDTYEDVADGDFQTLGNTRLGIKLFHSVLPWLLVGGDVHAAIPLNTTADFGRTMRSSGFGVRGNVTADLRELEGRTREIPIIARVNLGYTFDNTGKLITAIEQRRYAALPDDGPEARRPLPEEDRHLLVPIERYALQIDRLDRLTFGVGLEFPIRFPTLGIVASPIAEWIRHEPVNRQGYACPVANPASSIPRDGCLGEVGGAARRQSLIFGLRFMPPLRGSSVFTAVEIGLTGVRTPVRELAAQAPYLLMFGFSYAHDTRAR